MTEPMRPHILNEQPQVASVRLPSIPVEPGGAERQAGQDMFVHPDLATTWSEFQPTNLFRALLLSKRVEVLEDRRTNRAGFELNVDAVNCKARALAERLVADRSHLDALAKQLRQ